MKSFEQFNPLNDQYGFQYIVPNDLKELNLRVLTPFQRALLAIDGTVTKFIEAYTLEPVTIHCLSHEEQRLTIPNSWLKVSENTLVASRQVTIRGKYSRTLYVYAQSQVVLKRLPEAARERLQMQGQGIGRILNDIELETRREVLWYGREHIENLPEEVLSLTKGDFYSRAYIIIESGLPIAMINEKFPSSMDRLPALC